MERINGETIAGIALVILSILFIIAGQLNEIWATIITADYIILAIGIAFIILGVVTLKRNNKLRPETHSHH